MNLEMKSVKAWALITVLGWYRMSSVHHDVRKGAADPPRYRVGKGLMTSHGPFIPPLLPLLVKDKGYAMDTACFIVWDVDLDKCSRHGIDPLGDFGLHDMMRASLLIHPLALESSVCIGRPF